MKMFYSKNDLCFQEDVEDPSVVTPLVTNIFLEVSMLTVLQSIVFNINFLQSRENGVYCYLKNFPCVVMVCFGIIMQ